MNPIEDKSILRALWSCCLENWYQHPKLSLITFPTRFLRLPDLAVSQILNSQGIFTEGNAKSHFLTNESDADDDEWSRPIIELPKINERSSSTSSNMDEDQENEMEKNILNSSNDDDLLTLDYRECFKSIQEDIQKVMDQWIKPGKSGGGCFIKCHWKAPLDAHWLIPGGLLKCTSSDEVIVLLQASDAIRTSLEIYQQLIQSLNPLPSGIYSTDGENSSTPRHYVSIRKWHDIRKSMLFRCFVKSKNLIAFCQKEIHSYWGFSKLDRQHIEAKIDLFWNDNLAPNFQLDSYVFDVYLHGNQSVWLVDISPYHEEYTDPLLWSWKELDLLNGQPLAKRWVENQVQVMPDFYRMMTSLPYDLLEEQQRVDDDNPFSIEKVIERMKKEKDKE